MPTRPDNRSYMRHVATTVAYGFAVLLTACGCSREVPFPLAKVHGKIQFNRPIPRGTTITIHFLPDSVPAQGEAFPRPAQGVVDADGTFAHLTTNSPADGAILGAYRITLSAMGPQYEPLPSLFPIQYTRKDQTPWTADVKGGQDNEFQFVME
jgi:hypothetical protein